MRCSACTSGADSNVLNAALPLMAAAGYGSILGVTSGSGWRAADAGAYSCAKRAIASLTWQLGRQAPPGVTINAMSPIAATRMVAAAIERGCREGKASGGGGLSLESVPRPEDLGPFGAYLVEVTGSGGATAGCSSPAARRWRSWRSPACSRWCGATTWSASPGCSGPSSRAAFAAAEASQVSGGGGNPRYGPIFAEPGPAEAASAHVRSCAVVTDRPGLAASLTAALEARSVTCHRGLRSLTVSADAAKALGSVVDATGPIDAIVVAPEGRQPTASTDGWEQVLAEHRGNHRPHQYRRRMGPAAADYASSAARSVQLVSPYRRRHRGRS